MMHCENTLQNNGGLPVCCVSPLSFITDVVHILVRIFHLEHGATSPHHATAHHSFSRVVLSYHSRGQEPTTIPREQMLVLGMTSMGSTFTSVRSLRYVIYPVQVGDHVMSCHVMSCHIMSRLRFWGLG